MPRLIGTILFSAWISAQAQGGSAIITLVMPPPGGEGSSALQTGTAFADGAAAMYYNPASLAEVSRNTGSQFHFTNSRQDLLPVLQLDDLRQDFQALSGVLPDPGQGYDLGFGLFRNNVSFGKNQGTDQNGNPSDPFDSFETVYALGVGIRLGAPLSLGGSVKYYDSHLTAGQNGSGPARGWAFDVGGLIDPEFHPFDPVGIRSVKFRASLGMAYQNIGPDNFYNEALQADPIPTTYRIGLGLDFDFIDLLELRASNDLEKEIPRWDFSEQQITTSEYGLAFSIYRFAYGRLSDPDGKREEISWSNSIEVNALRCWRFRTRLRTGDFSHDGESLEKGFPFPEIRIGGIAYRANPSFSLGVRKIRSRDNGIREGQTAYFLSVSL